MYRTDFTFFQLNPELNFITDEVHSGSNVNQFCSTAIHTKYRQNSSLHSLHTKERDREREKTLSKVCKLYLYLMYRFFFI
jgi:hypothetical protein